MNDHAQWLLPLLAGALLGLMFFSGLWITVRQLTRSTHPIRLLLGSFLLRFGSAIAGFLVIANHFDGPGLLIATAAFFIPRVIMLRASRARAVQGNHAHDYHA